MTQSQEFGLPPLTNNSVLENKEGNITADTLHEGEFNHHYHLARMIETYFVPVTCSIGIIANILAVKTFLHKCLRNYSCSRYLIAKCISDTMFLINLFGIYIGNCFDFDLNTAKNICQIVIFITYVSAFLSVWTVLLVTVENFIRIRLPFEVKRLCSTRNANICISILVVTAVCIYSFSLWISDKNCNPVPEYSTVIQAFIYIDTLLTLIIPSILLIVLIFAILVKLLDSQRKRSNTNSEASNRLVSSTVIRKSKSKVAIVTKMLLSVSLTFFLLTVTSHIVRIKLLVSAFVSGKLEVSNTEAAVQRISQLFSYLSMAVNLFIFIAFGDNFRKVFRMIFFNGKFNTINQTNTDINQRSEMLPSRSVQVGQKTTGTKDNESTSDHPESQATYL